MTNVNQAPLPWLSKAPLVRASLVKRRYIKYLAFFYDPLETIHLFQRLSIAIQQANAVSFSNTFKSE